MQTLQGAISLPCCRHPRQTHLMPFLNFKLGMAVVTRKLHFRLSFYGIFYMNYADKALLIYSVAYQNKLSSILTSEVVHQAQCKLIPVTAKDIIARPGKYIINISHIVCYVDPNELRELIKIALERNLTIGLLRPPTLRQPLIFSHFGIPRKMADSVELALRLPEHRFDILYCNDEMVLGCLIIGDFPFFNNKDMTQYGDSATKCLMHFFRSLMHLFSQHPQSIIFTTAKGKVIQTAITGLAVVENASWPVFYVAKEDIHSTRDRQISVLMLAPSSITRYLQLLIRPLLPVSMTQAQQGLGYIKSESAQITSPKPMVYSIDGNSYRAQTLNLELSHSALALNVGNAYIESNEESRTDKERIVVDQLPQNETRLKYLTKALPLFPHALEEDFKDLLVILRENSQTTGPYLLLMVLSTVLASLGLFLNSTSVVIGAMVLAPLMAPIISLSMGLLRSDLALTRKSLATLGTGVMLALLFSATMALLLPYEKATSEILARTTPSILDLLVAVISGMAGAYANARESVSKSLPGVAIAVALVPPLCVSGIGLGWFNLDIFRNALLLFLTNLVGITLAASITFLLLGFSPFSRAARGVGLSVVMAAAVSVPLFFSFLGIIRSAKIERLLTSHSYAVSDQEMYLSDIRIRNEDKIFIAAALHSRSIPDQATLDQLKRLLEQELKKPIELSLALHLQR